MNWNKKWVGAGVAAVAIVAAGTGIAAKNIGDDGRPITGEALDRASAVALAYTGGGRVTETEEGDEKSYYQVEVTMPDGKQVDVQLDKSFNVVGSSSDNDQGGDS
ncbi:MAG TPA: PepSY domain-containing protein [Tepidiformaceae bacterium]|nr:PepSY domain-containing protein [Tepidiformaceae bacterium]